MVCCSGGIAYSEWRKFRERLQILPDVFEMEKKLNQYIYVTDLRGEICCEFVFRHVSQGST